jgi:hypothetical protein
LETRMVAVVRATLTAAMAAVSAATWAWRRRRRGGSAGHFVDRHGGSSGDGGSDGGSDGDSNDVSNGGSDGRPAAKTAKLGIGWPTEARADTVIAA